MNITSINDKMKMTYELYIKQPMQAAESELNMNVAKNPNQTFSPYRDINHPLSTKCSQIPFNK